MNEVVIVSAKRTAIGNFLGSLANVSAVNLGGIVIKAVLEEVSIDKDLVDEVIMGQVLQAGGGQNTARQASIAAGIAQSVPATTINKVCGSGMKAIHYAMQAIALGEAEIIVAGGQENMSLAPRLLLGSRQGKRMGSINLQDALLKDGLMCALNNEMHMGITAENLAHHYNISKLEQDEFALASQQKASQAQQQNRFLAEICAVTIQNKKEWRIFDQDEFIRHQATIELISQVFPAFIQQGSVSAANASGINDGASAVLVMSAKKAKQLGLKPLVKIIGFASVGVDPKMMGIGPVYATKKLLDNVNYLLKELDTIESNEVFAAQAIAVNKEIGWDIAKVNPNGGAIALGHPIGASGARIITTLIHEMLVSGKKTGLATMCIGGGQGIAGLFELV